MGEYYDGELVINIQLREVGSLVLIFMHPEDNLHKQIMSEEEVFSPQLLKFQREGIKIMKSYVKLRIAFFFIALICYSTTVQI